MNTLEIHNVTKIYGEGRAAVKAVDDVSLSVKKGEIVYIMGPSGSGKTTLISMAGCLLKPTSGSIKIEGQDITKLDEKKLPQIRRKNVGFIFQAFNLMRALTASENVQVVLNLIGVKWKEAQKQADRLLTELGLEKRLRFLPRELSGGEQQRVAIARALANNPTIIFADEPTGNLDSESGRTVCMMLKKIAKEQNKSVVIVSHDPRIKSIADRVILMEDG